MSAIKSSRKIKFHLKPIAFAMACCFALNAQANPTGAAVVNGQASFATIGNTLNITNSPNAIINWQGFSINAGETTRFIQQSASSSVLNRVLGADPSLLLGTLTSNGRVFLINPAGILVGQGARIDVPGFVASTLNITNSNFLANKLSFENSSPTGGGAGVGAIQNNGTITTTEGGAVYLIAPQIENNGIITTPKGETILAAGNTVQLVDTGTPGVLVEVTGSDNSATNLGQILADSGRVGMVAATIKNSGTISTNSLVSQGGKVFLRATNRVEAGGTITANGATGGKIEVLGNQVGVMDGATVSANGTRGGGTVLIGGDYQGKNPDVQNAQVTYFAPTATISADGGVLTPSPLAGEGWGEGVGNGGKVIVWADDTTRAYGNISARGGANGGDGGFVEVSGKQQLVYRAFTDTRAPQGKTGTLLLDPTQIDLIAGAGADAGNTMYGNNILVALVGSNVILQTSAGGTGNITFVAGNYDFTAANTTNSLSLLAYTDGAGSTGNINLPVGVILTMDSGAALNMVAGWDGGSTTVPVALNGFGNLDIVGSSGSPTFLAVGGAVKLIAGNNLAITGASVTSLGDMSVDVGGNLTLTAATSQAMLQSGGTQTINFTGGGVHLMNVYGGTGANGSVAAGKSALITSSGFQTISHAGTLAVALYGGDVTADTLSATNNLNVTFCTLCGTFNSATIGSLGGQDINATTIEILGGSGGNGNWAGIENKSTSAAQSITTTSFINLTGGTGAGYYNGATPNDSITNDASIHSDGTQTIVAGSINLLGGGDATTLGGAFLTGKLGQDITTTGVGNMVITGGASTAAGQYGLGAPAIIGEEFSANIVLRIGGNLTMTGGAGTTSQALIGAAQGTPNIDITAGAGIWMLDGGSSSRIGVLTGGPAGTLLMTATTLDITQGASSYINTDSLSAIATAGLINLAGPNLVNTVTDLSASGIIDYVSAQTVHIGSVTSTAAAAAGDVTIISTLGDIGLGTLDATGTATVTADGAIYDDNGIGVTNITAPTIHLTSNTGGVFGGLAISADTQVEAGGSIAATVQAAGSYGGIRIHNIATDLTAAGAPAAVALVDFSTNGGTITFTHVGDIDDSSTTISASTNHGDIAILVENLTESSGSITVDTPDSALIGATGDMFVTSNITNTNVAGSLGLAAGNSLNISGSVSGADLLLAAPTVNITAGGVASASGNASVAAGHLTITDGSLSATNNVYVNVDGDIRINAMFGQTSSITAGNYVFLNLGGATSNLYFNDQANPLYIGTAKVESGIATYLDFLNRSADGVEIDGVGTLTANAATASGFYNAGIEAAEGSNLFVTYYQSPTDFIGDYVDKVLPPPIAVDDIGPPPPDTFVVVVAPLPGSDSGGGKSFDSSNGGIGSSEPGAFGAGESSAPAAGGEAGKSDQGSGSNGDAKQDGDKKDEAKEDKKDKKDDTASKDEKNGKDDKDDKGKKDEKPGKC